VKERIREERSAGPQMAYRADPVRPTATIVLQAGSQSQMDQILQALSRMVSSYQQPVNQRAGRAR